MYNNIKPGKSILMLVLLITGSSMASMAATYTAAVSGNWSSSLTWGGTAPAFGTVTADNIVIPAGVTVTQDADVTINNAAATLVVTGTLTGTNNLNILAGTLSGAGTVVVNNLTVGTGGFITSVGSITAAQVANSQAALSISALMNVTSTVILNAGTVGLTTGGAFNLANNVTINMAGGTYNVAGGLPTLAGSYNLLYTGTVSTIGTESALVGLKDVTVDLASASNQLSLAGPLTVTGVLSLQQGVLKLAGNTLTIAGGVTTTAGTIGGSATSNLVINGTGSVGSIAFAASNQTLNNLTVAITGSGSVSLASNVAVSGITTLTSGSLNLNGYMLTIGGTIAAAGLGNITGSSTSSIAVNSAGAVGTLVFSNSGNTLGNLTVNTTGALGSVVLGSDLTVSNMLALSAGSLNLNGNNLTIGGTISASGTGSIAGSLLSDITFNGTGNAGTLVLTPLSQTIRNLTINIGSAGALALGSAVNVAGALTLAQGKVNIAKHDLTVLATGTMTGGSAASYIVTSDTGSLNMTVANAATTAMFQVGTMASYAPVTVINNSVTSGMFNVRARQGVLLNGTSGVDISQYQPMVNTSWNVESSITTGANVNLTMGWSSAMEVQGFSNTQAYVSHYTSGAWTSSAVSAASLSGGIYSLTLSGVTSFSPFAVFGKNIALGVSAISSNDVLSVYPNPATNKLTIATNSTDKTAVEICDLTGQVVANYTLSNDINTIDIATLNAGIYLIKVSGNSGSSIKRFVKI